MINVKIKITVKEDGSSKFNYVTDKDAPVALTLGHIKAFYYSTKNSVNTIIEDEYAKLNFKDEAEGEKWVKERLGSLTFNELMTK